MKKAIKYILIVLFSIFVLSICVVGYVVYDVKKNYPIQLLEDYEPLNPSIIYDINGKQIDVLSIENRDSVSIDEIPLNVQNAFIAVEDKRFRNHHGLDYLRLTKAVFLNVTRTGRQGGSTITQQFVKTAFLSSERSLKRKIIEAVLAIEMERIYTKDEILEYYLNTINFGKGVYGIKNASLKYFGVLPKDLSIAQAAILASIPKSPTKYSKIENALSRQKIVLKSMYKGNFITKEEYDKALNEPVKFMTNEDLENISEAQRVSNSNEAPEVTTIIINELKKILNIEEDSENNIFNGYKIYSTIDLDMQKAAYLAFATNPNLKKREKLEAALISIDSSNGFVKAIVGGKNYKKGDFNRAISSLRQPGSSFKPVVALALLKNNYPMNLILEDFPIKIGTWQPNNYDRKFRSNLTMLKALELSNNIAAIKMLDLVGVKEAKEIWKLSGANDTNFPNDLTTALGSVTISPLDMAKFYSALSNGGYKVQPQFIYKIENKYGEIIYEADTTKTKIYEAEDVALMTHILKGVVTDGTAKSASLSKNGKNIEVAGKTGTTSNYISAWFAGYTPSITTVVYVGFDDNKTMGSGMSGGVVAIPIWKTYMQKIVNLPNYNAGDFEYINENISNNKLVERNIDVFNGFLDVDGLNMQKALFKTGTEPLEYENSEFSNFIFEVE